MMDQDQLNSLVIADLPVALFVVDDDLSQLGAVTVEGNTLLHTGSGDICLTGGDCTGDGLNDNDFVGEVTAMGSTVEIVDVNDLVVGDITANNDVFLFSFGNFLWQV